MAGPIGDPYNMNLKLLEYTPIDEAARQQIEAGNMGNIQNVTLEDDALVVTTDLGTFKFGAPELNQPNTNLGPNAHDDAYANLGNMSHEENMTDIMDIMKLFHEVALLSRQSARENRQTEREAAVQAILDQADKIRDAAAWAMAAGIVTGTFQIVGGAMSAYGGAKASGQNAMATMQKWKGAGDAMSGLGQAGGAILNYFAEQARAEQKELEATQKVHDTAAQDESDWMQNMLEVVRDTRQKLEEVIRAQQESMKSIIRA